MFNLVLVLIAVTTLVSIIKGFHTFNEKVYKKYNEINNTNNNPSPKKESPKKIPSIATYNPEEIKILQSHFKKAHQLGINRVAKINDIKKEIVLMYQDHPNVDIDFN